MRQADGGKAYQAKQSQAKPSQAMREPNHRQKKEMKFCFIKYRKRIINNKTFILSSFLSIYPFRLRIVQLKSSQIETDSNRMRNIKRIPFAINKIQIKNSCIHNIVRKMQLYRISSSWIPLCLCQHLISFFCIPSTSPRKLVMQYHSAAQGNEKSGISRLIVFKF